MSQLTYADVFEAVAAAVPDRPALLRGSRSITWRDFDRRADALAQHLLEAGLARGAKVAAYLYNSPEYLETYFAAFKAGFVPFNVNYRYGESELFYLLDNADAEAVVFHASFAPLMAALRPRLPKLKALISVDEPKLSRPDWASDYERVVARRVPRVQPPWGRSPDDMIFIYTGGTTGLPKGVMWRQGDLFEASGGGANVLLGLGPLRDPAEAAKRVHLWDDQLTPGRTMPVAPLMHATSQLVALGTMVAGGAIATLPSNQFRAEELFDEIDRLRIMAIVIVGMAFALPMLEALEKNPGRWSLISLKRIFSSGTIWNADNKRGLLRHLPEVMLIDSLGSSEAIGVGITFTTASASSAPTAKFSVTDKTVVFTEDGRRVQPGSGERGLVAMGGSIPSGYYKDPERSAKTFRVFEGKRWSVPGDWATVEQDGAITLLGRGSHVINTGGEKVFPEEVEEVLKRCPGVRDAAVIGVPDERFGERICAVVDAEPGAMITLQLLAAHVRASLATYKAPRELVLAAIARQPNGKIDYASLRASAIVARKL